MLIITCRRTGEKVVLFLQEVTEALLQLQDVVEADLHLLNDTEDIEVGVPHFLLLVNLPVQVLGH